MAERLQESGQAMPKKDDCNKALMRDVKLEAHQALC